MTNTPITIQVSDNYSLFKRIDGNRSLNKPHIKRLKEAISQDTKSIRYNPIIVNDKKQVIDGQHRLIALMELKLPVYFIEEKGLKLENVQSLNSLSKSWSPMDYAKSFAELGNKNYIAYIEFKKTYGLNHDVLLSYLGLDNVMTSQMFKSGKFEAENVSKSHDLCKKLLEMGRFYSRYNRRSFALAFKRMWQEPNFSMERLLAKMEVHAGKIQDFALPEDYIRVMEKMYNSHESEQDRVRFY